MFSLEEGERGETDLVEMEIDTGDAASKRQPSRSMPFAVQQEVVRQLLQIHSRGIIEPSRSPWASPHEPEGPTYRSRDVLVSRVV